MEQHKWFDDSEDNKKEQGEEELTRPVEDRDDQKKDESSAEEEQLPESPASGYGEEEREFTEQQPAPAPLPEDQPEEPGTIVEPQGEKFDAFRELAVLVLIDIAPEVKRFRRMPEIFHIKRPETIIGTRKKAHIKADDFKTVRDEHGVIVFDQGVFRLCPLEGEVYMGDQRVDPEGAALENGSYFIMGSAHFVFLCARIQKADEETTMLK